MMLVAVDIETTGLTPRRHGVVSVQFAWREDGVVRTLLVDDARKAFAVMERLHAGGAEFVGQNFSFDLAHLYAATDRFVKFRVWDTMWMYRLAFPKLELDPSLFGMDSISLEAQSKNLLGWILDKSVRKTFADGTLTGDKAAYGGKDAAATLLLGEIYMPYMQTVSPIVVEGLRAATLLSALASARGMRIDKTGVKETVQILSDKIDTLRRRIEEFGLSGTAINSPNAILNKLRELGAKVQSTSETVLVYLSERGGRAGELADLILEYREATKQKQFFSVLDTEDLRGLFSVARAASLRMTAGEPNIQQLPKDTRRYIKPVRGKFFRADYSQQELRIAATLWGIDGMLEVWKSGGDVHEETAAAMFPEYYDLPVDERKPLRKIAKSINFGALYGIGAQKLAKYVKANAGIDITEDEAREYLYKWKTAYPQIREKHNEAYSLFRDENGNTIDRWIYVDVGLGVLRPVNKPTTWLNTQIQTVGALILYNFCRRLAEVLPDASDIDALRVIPVAFVHDEVLVELTGCGDCESERAALERMMIEAGNEVLSSIVGSSVEVIQAESEIKSTWV